MVAGDGAATRVQRLHAFAPRCMPRHCRLGGSGGEGMCVCVGGVLVVCFVTWAGGRVLARNCQRGGALPAPWPLMDIRMNGR